MLKIVVVYVFPNGKNGYSSLDLAMYPESWNSDLCRRKYSTKLPIDDITKQRQLSISMYL